MVFILLVFTLVFFALLEVLCDFVLRQWKNNMLIKFGFSRFAEDSCEHSMPPASVYRFMMHLRYRASFTGFKRN